MRRCVAYVLFVAGAAAILQAPVQAASVPGAVSTSERILVHVGTRQNRPKGDCTPYNGPFGFYGNIWCQPTNEASYLRNLGASWPMETPASLRQRRATKSTDW